MTANNSSPSFLRAVLVIILALVLYDVMSAIVKHLGSRYSTQELTVFRNLFGLVPALTILLTSRGWADAGRPVVFRQWPLAIARGCLGVFAQMSLYLSLRYMDLATASTLVFAGPLFIAALSVPILGQRIGLWRWSAIAMGFLGVILILRPDGSDFGWYSLLPILAALGFASTSVTAKLFEADVPTALINLYYTTTALIGATIIVMATVGFAGVTAPADWLWLVGMGVVGGLAAFCMTTANRMADPSSLSPFHYFGIPSSFVLGWLFFAEAPFDDLIPGVFLIVGGGLLIIWRERVYADQAA
ncbi:DMT family transporter [Jannaschia aquimarina]|uniref:RibN_1 protein n=1 Tax=Jannaschia aquimarina TaxID=935700 RepID=A0A0D1D9J1_9RHOB|nr:DMT family transporter [Jannaschia aquimarina]KIT16563.1 Riboflavin transporter [Jannaschia aquimarina]SNT41785.1 EamA domain-containing membrane protein RarD [Jannaschia aquimarina]